MGYNYDVYIKELEKYCSTNKEMNYNIIQLKEIISKMNNELKKLCIGFTKEDYTKEEIKKMDDDKIKYLFKVIIEKAKNIYYEYNDITSYKSCITFDSIYFYDNDYVELSYEIFGSDDYIHIILTENEFFNEDANSFRNRMKKEYERRKFIENIQKEIDKNKEIEYLKKRLQELTKEI